MNQPIPETKPNGFYKKCRDCNQEIYLHRGSSGPWRAFEAAPAGDPEEWRRHRCPAGLQDAEIMGIIAPPGSKPADLHPRLRRVGQDLLELADQAEKRIPPA
jgi:hypothetical protein